MKSILIVALLLSFTTLNFAQTNLLNGTSWKFVRYTNYNASTSFNLTTYDFTIRFDSMKVYIKICNQLSAKYSLNSNQITFKSLFGTKSICEDKISNTEYDVIDNFNALNYSFKADSLILSNDKTKHEYFLIKKK